MACNGVMTARVCPLAGIGRKMLFAKLHAFNARRFHINPGRGGGRSQRWLRYQRRTR